MRNIALFLLLQFFALAFAQPGSLDTTFKASSVINGEVYSSLIQPDGKILITGEFYNEKGNYTLHVARLNTDGSLDSGFNIAVNPVYSDCTTMLLPNGKIIVGGFFGSNDIPPIGIARFNADGSFDKGFNPGSGTNLGADINSTSLQADGKIIVGGQFKTYDGVNICNIARLNADGSLDTSFKTGMGLVPGYYKVITTAIQSDGKIIIGGTFEKYDGITRIHLARLNPDGTLDLSFNSEVDLYTPYTGWEDAIYRIIIQPDGKIIIAGTFSSYNGTDSKNIARLNSDGSYDTSFKPAKDVSAIIKTISLQEDGKIIIGGLSPSHQGMLACLNADGSLDSCFNPVTLYGDFDYGSGGENGLVYTTSLQPDGKIIVGGNFSKYNGTSTDFIARANNSTLTTPMSSAQSLCAGSTIANLVATGTGLKWYATASGGVPLAPTVVLSSGTYYVSQTTGCESARAPALVTIKESIVPTFTQVSPICAGALLVLPPASDNGIAGTWSPPSDITKTTTYTFNSAPESCGTTTTMTVEVKVLPNIDADYTKVICSGSNEDVQLNAGLLSGLQSDYSYQWSKDGVLLPSEQGYNMTVTTDGVYPCVVKDKITGCQKTRVNTVAYSETVTIKDVLIVDLTERNTVTVESSNPENSEYSLDNPTGPFQDSNMFENVEPAIHTVYLNDKKGCGIDSKTIAVVGAPPFFTPNGDGINDKWNLQGISEKFYKKSTVEIFDRYGKLLKVLSDAQSDGWDGTYNGQTQLADDYWFVINLDGRMVKGHFALKR